VPSWRALGLAGIVYRAYPYAMVHDGLWRVAGTLTYAQRRRPPAGDDRPARHRARGCPIRPRAGSRSSSSSAGSSPPRAGGALFAPGRRPPDAASAVPCERRCGRGSWRCCGAGACIAAAVGQPRPAPARRRPRRARGPGRAGRTRSSVRGRAPPLPAAGASAPPSSWPSTPRPPAAWSTSTLDLRSKRVVGGRTRWAVAPTPRHRRRAGKGICHSTTAAPFAYFAHKRVPADRPPVAAVIATRAPRGERRSRDRPRVVDRRTWQGRGGHRPHCWSFCRRRCPSTSPGTAARPRDRRRVDRTLLAFQR